MSCQRSRLQNLPAFPLFPLMPMLIAGTVLTLTVMTFTRVVQISRQLNARAAAH
jgi:hypothetical protein